MIIFRQRNHLPSHVFLWALFARTSADLWPLISPSAHPLERPSNGFILCRRIWSDVHQSWCVPSAAIRSNPRSTHPSECLLICCLMEILGYVFYFFSACSWGMPLLFDTPSLVCVRCQCSIELIAIPGYSRPAKRGKSESDVVLRCASSRCLLCSAVALGFSASPTLQARGRKTGFFYSTLISGNWILPKLGCLRLDSLRLELAGNKLSVVNVHALTLAAF